MQCVPLETPTCRYPYSKCPQKSMRQSAKLQSFYGYSHIGFTGKWNKHEHPLQGGCYYLQFYRRILQAMSVPPRNWFASRAARLPLVSKVVVVIAPVKFSHLENTVVLSAGVDLPGSFGANMKCHEMGKDLVQCSTLSLEYLKTTELEHLPVGVSPSPHGSTVCRATSLPCAVLSKVPVKTHCETLVLPQCSTQLDGGNGYFWHRPSLPCGLKAVSRHFFLFLYSSLSTLDFPIPLCKDSATVACIARSIFVTMKLVQHCQLEQRWVGLGAHLMVVGVC